MVTSNIKKQSFISNAGILKYIKRIFETLQLVAICCREKFPALNMQMFIQGISNVSSSSVVKYLQTFGTALED